MKINIYIISKKDDDALCEYYKKMCKNFNVEINIINIFNKNISQAQKINKDIAREAYSTSMARFLGKNSVLLSEESRQLDSIEFAALMQKYLQKHALDFFIAGAYGFDKNMLKDYECISLSKLTFSHNLAKIILLEQIYRSLCIIKNHPYHKGS